MHSFHHSRGRVLFEAVCAFGLAAACAVASTQTGAPALLAAAAIAALYGLVHLFDLRRPATVEAVEPQRLAVEPEVFRDQPVEEPAIPAEVAEPVAPPAKPARGAKAPRKSNGRAANVRKEAKVARIAPAELAEVAVAPVEMEVVEPMFAEEDSHPPLAPLFEPEPFARMHRRAFGRKAG